MVDLLSQIDYAIQYQRTTKKTAICQQYWTYVEGSYKKKMIIDED